MPFFTYRPWYRALILGLLLNLQGAIAWSAATVPTSLHPSSTREDLTPENLGRDLPLPTHASPLHPSNLSPSPLSPSILLSLVRYRRPVARRPRWGAPRWSAGGAARGDGCRDGRRSPVVPLIPLEDSNDNASFIAETAEPFPSLLVYVPETTAVSVSLLIIAENRDGPPTSGQEIYDRELPLPPGPGIVRFALADAENPIPLTPGVPYTLNVSLVCQPNDPSGNPFVQGMIQRIALPAELEPKAVDPVPLAEALDRIEDLGTAGLWYETLAELADLYCENPQDSTVRLYWQTLLGDLMLPRVSALVTQVQSQTIADAPLLWCGDLTP